MDFTLSLAHFCELHGPTSLLCTQALPVECSSCYPALSQSSSPRPRTADAIVESPSYFQRRPPSATFGGFGVGDGDRCASCRMTLPEEVHVHGTSTTNGQLRSRKAKDERPPLRTKEQVHICALLDREAADDELHTRYLPALIHFSSSDAPSCHSHNLEYISSSSPAESDTFSSLRRATVRTLSGEQLPRGQTSGPLWFGDPIAGYTIAYVFRLPDIHARGRQRYYALLALAGTDTQRAFEACTMIWSLFEQIAMHIVRSAEKVATRCSSSLDDSPPERRGQTITPISSFLTGRTMDPDGYPRRGGVGTVRANGIAELVDNGNFFCELHVIFVGMLQELGRLLGGMRVKPTEELHAKEAQMESNRAPAASRDAERLETEAIDDDITNLKPSIRPAKIPMRSASDDARDSAGRCPTPLYSPGIVAHRHQVVV